MRGIEQLMAQRGAPQGQPQPASQSQGSTISPELLNALATQRALKAKQTAMQSLQQEMAQSNVAKDNEQALLQLSGQEMLQQKAPTMQRNMMQQQQAIQQAPQRAARAEQGLAQLQQRMQQQQRPQQNFRMGGIVQNFREGGLTEEEKLKLEEDKKPQLGGIAGALYRAPEAINRGMVRAGDAVNRAIVGDEYYDSINGIVRPKPTADKPTEPTPKVGEQKQTTAKQTTPSSDSTRGLNNINTETETIDRDGRGTGPVAPDTDAFMAQLRELGDVEAGMVDMDKVRAGAKANADFFGIGTTTEADAKKNEEATFEKYKDRMMYDETMSDLEKIAERRKQLYEDSQGRDKLGLIADFLIGFGGGTTFAAGMQGASANLARSVSQAKDKEMEALGQYEAALRDKNTNQREMLMAATNAAQASYDRTLQQRIAEQQMKSAMVNQLQQTESANVNRQLEADIANLTKQQTALTEGFRGQLRKYVADVEAKSRTGSQIETSTALINLISAVDAFKAGGLQAVRQSPEFIKQQNIALDEDAKPEQVEAAELAMGLMLTAVNDSKTMKMVEAIRDDLFDKSNIIIKETSPEDALGYTDAAGEDENPSEELLKMAGQ